MRLERRWLITLAGLLALGVALEVAVGYAIDRFSALYGAEMWLRNGGGATRVLLARTFDDLETLAEARAQTGQRLDPNAMDPALAGRWLAVTPAGVKSGVPACDGVTVPPGLARAIVWCHTTPMLAASVRGQAGVYFIAPLGEAYADELKQLTLHEVELWGPHGLVATTLTLESGARASGPPPTHDGFERVAVELPGPYVGFFPHEDTQIANAANNRGARRFDALRYVSPLAEELGPGDLRVVALVPADAMLFGPKVSGIAMGGLGLVIIAGLMLLARGLTRQVSGPLRNLERAAKAAAEGNAGFEVEDSGTFEVASLSTSVAALKARIEEQQRRAAQSEKMAAIGALAGGVAHEINNPLGVILGFAQGMERRVPQGDPLRMPVTSIVREALRCKALVQELLTFSRASAGKKSDEEVDVRAAVESSVLLLGARARTQNVELITQLEPGLPRLKGSGVQVQQVLVNLGTNALDAMKQGGTLTLRAAARDGDMVLEVSDTGGGIPENIRQRIFEPFFTTKAVGEGTGLGLSIVYEIVQQHHGRVDVVSSTADGTMMRVTLPLSASAATPASMPAVQTGAPA